MPEQRGKGTNLQQLIGYGDAVQGLHGLMTLAKDFVDLLFSGDAW